MSVTRVLASEVKLGDEIAWPDGSSLTVEGISRDGDIIDFTGTRNVRTFMGTEAHPGGVGSSLADGHVSVVVR